MRAGSIRPMSTDPQLAQIISEVIAPGKTSLMVEFNSAGCGTIGFISLLEQGQTPGGRDRRASHQAHLREHGNTASNQRVEGTNQSARGTARVIPKALRRAKGQYPPRSLPASTRAARLTFHALTAWTSPRGRNPLTRLDRHGVRRHLHCGLAPDPVALGCALG